MTTLYGNDTDFVRWTREKTEREGSVWDVKQIYFKELIALLKQDKNKSEANNPTWPVVNDLVKRLNNLKQDKENQKTKLNEFAESITDLNSFVSSEDTKLSMTKLQLLVKEVRGIAETDEMEQSTLEMFSSLVKSLKYYKFIDFNKRPKWAVFGELLKTKEKERKIEETEKLKLSEFEGIVNTTLDKDREKRDMLDPIWANLTEGVDNVLSLMEVDINTHPTGNTFKERAEVIRKSQNNEENITAIKSTLKKLKLAQREHKEMEERDDSIWEALLFLKSSASGQPVDPSLLEALIDKVVDKVEDGVESLTGLGLASACDVCKVSL